jgi:hypothetical protein
MISSLIDPIDPKVLSPAGLKKTNFQKLKQKTKKKLGFQRIDPMTFCIRAQAATVVLISHFKILTYEEL